MAQSGKLVGSDIPEKAQELMRNLEAALDAAPIDDFVHLAIVSNLLGRLQVRSLMAGASIDSVRLCAKSNILQGYSEEAKTSTERTLN